MYVSTHVSILSTVYSAGLAQQYVILYKECYNVVSSYHMHVVTLYAHTPTCATHTHMQFLSHEYIRYIYYNTLCMYRHFLLYM